MKLHTYREAPSVPMPAISTVPGDVGPRTLWTLQIFVGPPDDRRNLQGAFAWAATRSATDPRSRPVLYLAGPGAPDEEFDGPVAVHTRRWAVQMLRSDGFGDVNGTYCAAVIKGGDVAFAFQRLRDLDPLLPVAAVVCEVGAALAKAMPAASVTAYEPLPEPEPLFHARDGLGALVGIQNRDLRAAIEAAQAISDLMEDVGDPKTLLDEACLEHLEGIRWDALAAMLRNVVPAPARGAPPESTAHHLAFALQQARAEDTEAGGDIEVRAVQFREGAAYQIVPFNHWMGGEKPGKATLGWEIVGAADDRPEQAAGGYAEVQAFLSTLVPTDTGRHQLSDGRLLVFEGFDESLCWPATMAKVEKLGYKDVSDLIDEMAREWVDRESGAGYEMDTHGWRGEGTPGVGDVYYAVFERKEGA
jgi:hypothetical protein